MSMTRKDYQLIANSIKGTVDNMDIDSERRYGIHLVVLGLSVDLAEDNARFDAAKFEADCGFPSK